MKKTINDFIESLQLAIENRKYERMTVDKKGFHGEYITGDNYLKVQVSFTGTDGDFENEPSKKQKEEHNECLKLRNDFRDYILRLDDNIFNKACKRLSKNQLHELHEDIMHGQLDSTTLKEKIKIFKDAVNQTIMEAVVRLKSQMN